MSLSILESVGLDVLYLIAQELAQRFMALESFSLVSSKIRSACMPVLFHSCRIVYRNGKIVALPPVVIRSFVQRLVYRILDGALGDAAFGNELWLFPIVRYICFVKAEGGVPWVAIKACLTCPQITSISFSDSALWTEVDEFPEEDVCETANRLTALSYTPYPWREYNSVIQHTDLEAEYAVERRCLAALINSMSNLAESLNIPCETSPLQRMAKLSWPNLRDLSIHGRYLSPQQSFDLRDMLSDIPFRLPSLRRLSVDVAQHPECPRAPTLGRSSSLAECPTLQSLTISYPDPDDAIFSVKTPNLTFLSLRDSPRHYYYIHCREYYDWVAPILTSSECLDILRRMYLPRLEYLELVYEADDKEDGLLQYIVSTHRLLLGIRLHRYRRHHDDTVPYMHIARRLSALRYLRDIRLNLDCRETTSPMCYYAEKVLPWIVVFKRMGLEMLPVFQEACPFLVRLKMLIHLENESLWADFNPKGNRSEPYLTYKRLGEWDSCDSISLPGEVVLR